ncbi:MAG: type II toxin-antitoxin system PemK/MazF family toxin [Alphaproteobacteria bacterium]|nr:type II toxin-antitoxin system PemK/MazF family toxin [Alphaproteobacteria bacterium]
MRRGEVWTVAGGGAYAGKPRPVVIVQSDLFGDLASATFCPITTERIAADFVRPSIAPSRTNGLQAPSQVMIDKITTVPKARLGAKIGTLSEDDLLKVRRALVLFLGIGA